MSRLLSESEGYSKDPHLAGVLLDSLRRKNLADFRLALEELKCDPNLSDASTGLSVFETILQIPKSVEFIKLCIDHGACFYAKSGSGRYPIHFVIKSLCPENLDIFLRNYDRSKVNLKYNTQNSLHLITHGLTKANYHDVEECIKLLLSYGCSPNLPDNTLTTPFLMVLQKEETLQTSGEIANFILMNCDIDFHTYKSQELISLVTQRSPEYQIKTTAKVIDFGYMMGVLENHEELDFEIYFKAFQSTARESFNDSCLRFLETSVSGGMRNVVEFLMEKRVDVNQRASEAKYMKPPAFLACSNGYHQILALLLKKIDLKFAYQRGNEKYTLLHEVCQNFTRSLNGNVNVNFQKCFDLLIKDRRCDLNAKDDLGCTALHYTVKYKNNSATIALLKKGVYINEESCFGKTPIDEISYATLETFLDESIVVATKNTNDEKIDDIVINYSFLVPPNRKPELFHKVEPAKEIKSLLRISENNDLGNLVNHPVLKSFLFMKWSKLNFIFYINMTLSLVFLLTSIAFFIASQSILMVDRNQNMIFLGLKALFLITICLYMVREMVQCILDFRKYFKCLINWLEMLLISIAWIIFWSDSIDHSIDQRILSAFLIVGAFFEVLQIMLSMPSLSFVGHLETLGRVCVKVLKNVTLFFVIIITMGFLTYMISNDIEATNMRNVPQNSSTEHKRMFDTSVSEQFSLIFNCFESATSNVQCANLFLLSFVTTAIVLWLSLVKAIASSYYRVREISDDIFAVTQRINLYSSYESIVFNNDSYFKRISFGWLRSNISLFPLTISNGHIIIRQGNILTTKGSQPSNGNRMMSVVNTRPLITNCETEDAQIFSSMPDTIMDQIKTILNVRKEHKIRESNQDKLREEIITMRKQMNYQMKLNNELLAEQRSQLKITKDMLVEQKAQIDRFLDLNRAA